MTNTTGNESESASETHKTFAPGCGVATETQGSQTAKTKPGAIKRLFGEAIKGTTDRPTGEAKSHSQRYRSTEIGRFFIRAAKKNTRRRVQAGSLPSAPQPKNIVVSFAKAAGDMMTRLARDIEKALGFAPSAGEIERREREAAACQRAWEDAEELKRHREFLERMRDRPEARL